MLSNVLIVALAAAPLVAAHGKVIVMSGDAGGNTTALGILGGVVPGTGSDSVTEADTTVFSGQDPLTDGLGRTAAGGDNSLDDLSAVFASSGSVLPQVSNGGSISGLVHIVTPDGAGPYSAVVDTTGTGAFSTGTEATVITQVPGNNGQVVSSQRRFVSRMLVGMGLMKRDSDVNKDFPFSATIPAGTTCTGNVAGQSNVCLVKIVNPSGGGPFGGVIAIQIASSGAEASNSTDTGAAASATVAAAASTTDAAVSSTTDAAAASTTDAAAAAATTAATNGTTTTETGKHGRGRKHGKGRHGHAGAADASTSATAAAAATTAADATAAAATTGADAAASTDAAGADTFVNPNASNGSAGLAAAALAAEAVAAGPDVAQPPAASA